MKLWFLLLAAGAASLCLLACGGKKQEVAVQNTVATGNSLIDSWTKKIAATPTDANLYAARAKAFYEAESYEFAAQDITKAIALDSLNVSFHQLLSDIYLESNQSRLALKVMERAAALSNDSLPTLLQLAELQLILRQNQESLQTIKKILDKDHQNSDAFLLMGTNLKEMKDTARAIKSFQQAAALNANLTDAWINLGNLMSAQNKPIAVQYFDNALRTDTTNKVALHSKAVWYQQHGELQKALDIYKKIALANPLYADAFFNAALVYIEMDSLERALAELDITIRVAPTYAKAYYQRGLIFEQRQNKTAAKADFQRATTLLPSFEPAQKALTRTTSN